MEEEEEEWGVSQAEKATSVCQEEGAGCTGPWIPGCWEELSDSPMENLKDKTGVVGRAC